MVLHYGLAGAEVLLEQENKGSWWKAWLKDHAFCPADLDSQDWKGSLEHHWGTKLCAAKSSNMDIQLI